MTAGTAASIDWDGLAGIDDLSRGRFLAGVFLDDSEPADPPPAGLSIPDIDFTALSPALRQLFFIGDGKTAGGVTQTFHVPPGATRLYLGYLDSGLPDPTLPGWYGDNVGSVRVTARFASPLVPLGGVFLHLVAAAALVGSGVAVTRRRSK